MAKVEYVTNPLFNEILKKLKVKGKYVKNAKNYVTDKSASKELISIVNSRRDFVSFLSSSFIYNDTPEGSNFWFNIVEKGYTLEEEILKREKDKENKG